MIYQWVGFMSWVSKIRMFFLRIWYCLTKGRTILAVFYEEDLYELADKGYILQGEVVYIRDKKKTLIYTGEDFHPWPPKPAIQSKKNAR